MSNEGVKQLLERLSDELRSTELDVSTRALLAELDDDIHGALAAPESVETSTIVEKAELLETRFASTHPLAERFMRELIEMLAKMGV
jgi:hypothetical protein